MLKSLFVKNYALIENITVQLDEGFNIITGETGAGKSILLGALGLIQGNRADTSVVRKGETKCIVEGHFEIKDVLKPFFDEHDLDFDKTTIVRREVGINGKSRAFINDSPISLNVLRSFMDGQVDIHSQHETIELKQESYLLSLLDGFADNQALLNEYEQDYQKIKELEQQILQYQQQLDSFQENQAFNEFQLKELEEIDLDNIDQDTLETSFKSASDAEKILGVLHQTEAIFENNEFSILGGLNNVEQNLSSIQDALPNAELYSRLKSVNIELKDIYESLVLLKDDIVLSPQELVDIENVLNRLYALQRKHNKNSVKELIEYREQLIQSSFSTEELEEKIETSRINKRKLLKSANTTAEKLSAKRKAAAKTLSKEVLATLKDLKMVDCRLELSFENLDELSKSGKDKITFLFQSNKGEDLQPLHKIASGGELSRLVLSLKNTVASKMALPTIIFDEIDTGVSGEVALKLANVLKSMSKNMQVICITHLPQVAGKGDVHFRISKKSDQSRTYTTIETLDTDDRVEEISQMIAGEEITDSVKRNAVELMQG
ncbi:MAG: DNA repair protein RecN [Flavobacteriales bacterium]|nr:DNA repair protein RecN [Flavobacteriales bacterium]